MNTWCVVWDWHNEQSHHHMMCSICGRRFATPRFGERRSRRCAHSVAWDPISSLLTHMVYRLQSFELLRWLQRRLRPPISTSDPDTMTVTALEAKASSNGKMCFSSKYLPTSVHHIHGVNFHLLWRGQFADGITPIIRRRSKLIALSLSSSAKCTLVQWCKTGQGQWLGFGISIYIIFEQLTQTRAE